MGIETIGAWGDSIIYGAGDGESLGWVGRLRRRMEADHAIHTYNFGICGETSANLLSRFEIELKSIDPELVLIGIGTNDSLFRNGKEDERETSLTTYRENLEKLFRLAKAQTNHVFAVGLTAANDKLVQPIPWSTTKKSYKTSILKEYDEAMQEVSKANDVSYIDMWDILIPQDLIDGLHPDAVGYQRMYEKIYEEIKSLL